MPCRRLYLSLLVYLAWASMLHAWDAWDLADNFSITTNPNGQWTYGYMSGSTFVAFPLFTTTSYGYLWYDSNISGVSVWKSIVSYFEAGIYPSQVSVNCNSGTPSVKWTAPSDHQYYISLIVGGNLNHSVTGHAGNYRAANAKVFINGNSVTLQQTNAYEYMYTGSHYLSANQTILLYISEQYGAGDTQVKFTVFYTAYSPSDLASDYVITNPTNPNGQWTYQYVSEGNYYTDNTYEVSVSGLTSAVTEYQWYYSGTTAKIKKYSATSYFSGVYPNMISLISYTPYLPAVTWKALYSYRYYVLVNVGGNSTGDGYTGAVGNRCSSGARLLVNSAQVTLSASNSYEYVYSGFHFLNADQTVVLYFASGCNEGIDNQVKFTVVPTTSFAPSAAPTLIPSATPSIQPTYYPSLSPHSISVISTIAGTGTASYSGDNGQATSATINMPTGIVIDSNGNVYFNDHYNHRVRKITASTGIITTYAGTGSTSYNGDGGVASSAALFYPNGLAMDTSGNLYIADRDNQRIRKILVATSVISTIAGTGSASYSGDNGQATSAAINSPVGVAVDTSGNVYFSDNGNHRVRKISVSMGMITTIAGTGVAGFSGDGGAATAATLYYPFGINLDNSLNVYFGVVNNVVRKITMTTGIIITVAGTGSGGYNGDNVQATAATLYIPHDVVLDSYGNLYISDRGNHRVRKVDVTTGVITTIIGTGSASSTGDGFAATSASVYGPCYSRFDSVGNYYITECEGYRVRKVVTVTTDIPTAAPSIQPTYYPSLSPHSISVISTIAGTGAASYSGDNGQATAATIYSPSGIDFDSNGNVYFNEFSNHRVRKITVSTGIINTYAGTGTCNYNGDGIAATSAALCNPEGLVFDSSGDIYVTDFSNLRVRKITVSTSIISTIAGTGTASFSGDNGPATSADIYGPIGIDFDTSGNIYIADFVNHRVRKITVSTGIINTIAGTGAASYSGDNGPATAASLNYPCGLAVDSYGNVYIADYNNGRIRKITASTGVISTLAGTGSNTYNGDDMAATSASLYGPHAVILDSYGNLFIADRYNHRIRKVTISTGMISTVVGTGSASSSGDGAAATAAAINAPFFCAFDSSYNLYISEFNDNSSGNRVRKVVTVSTDIPTLAPTNQPTYYPSLSPHSISVISTIAGTGTASYSGDNGPTTSASISNPHGIDIDSSGNVYFSDHSNHRVRKITASTRIITTYAGTGATTYDGDGGLASSAALFYPNGLCLDMAGNLYIADSNNHRIRKVLASTNVISTIAGTGLGSYNGDNGLASSATLYFPAGVAVDTSGNVYISDSPNHRIRKVIASTSVITTIAGNGVSGFSGDNGPATAAAIAYPVGVNLDSSQNVYFGNYNGYNVIRKITVSTGVITTVAGSGSTSGGYNGDNIQATAAMLNYPYDAVLDSYGNLYITDSLNNRIRKVDASTGVISTVVGTGTASSSGDGSAATSATIYTPTYSHFDSAGNYYISEGDGYRIRKVVIVTTDIPTSAPSYTPSIAPTPNPSVEPSITPSEMPSVSPTEFPTMIPSTASPTLLPSYIPSITPTYTPSTSPTEYPTYFNGVNVYFTVTQLFYNVSYSQYAADKVVNDALIIDAVVEAIGYDLRETDVTVISSSKQQQHTRALSSSATATDTLSMSYYVDSVSYIFADADIATQVYMQALEAAISNGVFTSLLYKYAVSKNSTLVSTTHTTAVLNTAGPTSSPSSSPTAHPTKAPINLVAANILGTALTAEVVQKKTNYYLGAYLAYFLCIYISLYLVAYSRVGAAVVARLYESAYDSNNFSKCTNELEPSPENSAISDVLRPIYESNKRVHGTVLLEVQINKLKANNSFRSNNNNNIEGEDGEEGGEVEAFSSELSTMGSSRRMSMNSRLLSIMMKNKELFSAAFQEYLTQRRTLLGSSGVLFPTGYSVSLCGRTFTIPVGVMENFILFVCINHALFNCFYYVKGSKLGRHGTKLVYICREIVVFVLSQFVGLVIQYVGATGTGTTIFINSFIVVPLAQSIGSFLVTLYTCPCTESVEFQSKYTRLHGYVLLLGRLALLPILLVIFISLIVACIFSTATKIGLIIAKYAVNVQILGVVQLLVTCALSYVDDYYFEVSICRYKVVSVGGMYLERIVLHRLKANTDFTAKKAQYLCGLVTIVTIVAGSKAVSDDPTHVAIEMNSTTISALHATTTTATASEVEVEEEVANDEVLVEEIVTAPAAEEEVSYDCIYTTTSSSMTDEVIQYNDMEVVRTGLMEANETNTIVVEEQADSNKIDVDSMSLAELVKQYKKEKEHVVDQVVDDKLFEEWKISKRKHFKQGTRGSFVAAYNVYEDMFSKNTYLNTVNPLLASSNDDTLNSANHTRKLFTQSSFKNSLKNKKKI